MNGRKAREQRGLKYRSRQAWGQRSGERRCTVTHGSDDIAAGASCPACGATR